MANKVYSDQSNVAEKSPTLLSLYVHCQGRKHELYVERTPTRSTTFDCARCDFFEQVPRSASDEDLVKMQYATLAYMQNNRCTYENF